ncbi:hypothetical protein LTR56_020727 [Elasticomyces elasticus]|nr:hypothetical protein LTR56_020727 [Elasticomyces elasticus]KAK3632591.1 hypothetical protein LTR22_020527 [Elasticomyces elasticus]KAK4914965.1 hypothetical protein LTR49_016830 [Elasticomyces elasticus]KAK5748654.1 hypothetical protein LTS12_021287 [Elasticomyces elasticus]
MAPIKRKAAVHEDRSTAKKSNTTTRARNKTKKAAATAFNAVFNTTELLEMVLVGIDTKTLLLAQRVNRKWRAVISDNHQLQQKLFMRLATREEAIALGMVQADARLLQVDNMDTDPMNTVEAIEAYATADWFVLLNPLAADDRRDIFFAARLATGSREREAEDHKSQSWQRMYATMPPPQQLYIRASLNKGRNLRPGTGTEYTVNCNRTLGQAMAWVEAVLVRDGLPRPVWNGSEIGLPHWRQRRRNDDELRS